MTTDNIRLRSEFLNTQVITRDNGKKLGVVKEILVDIDRREVVSFGLRDNLLSMTGMPQYMYLASIRQTGDVILVDDENVIEPVDIDAYTTLINSEVITETGEPIGRVRDFQFDPISGKVISIVVASLGLPLIPEQLISTYEFSIEEVISSGPNRLIVFEGAEERLTQLSVGILERMGIGRPPWEKEEEEIYYPPTARPENQLPTGIPIRTPVEAAKPAPALEQRWDEDDEYELARPASQQMRAMRYEDEYQEAELEEDNWGEAIAEREVQTYRPPIQKEEYDYGDEDVEYDVWDDSQTDAYKPQRVNIPERQKERIPEYEEEAG
jgi:sporulation protein YlmC with PRC-barrel domain